MTLDMNKLREYASELGYWPATTDDADIDRHRRLNTALDKAPTMEKIQSKWQHDRVLREREEREVEQRKSLDDIYEGYYPEDD